MLRKCLSFLMMIAIAFSLTPAFAGDSYKLVSGSKKGTYYKIAVDLAKSARDKGVNIHVEDSYGSTSNLMILGLNQADLAICQFDVLDHFELDPRTRSLINDVRVVAPLYMEEVHILVRDGEGISSLKDLKGKTVGLGEINSGTFYTAREILEAGGLKVSDVLPNFSAPSKAVKKLMKGDLDAVFFTAGQPVKLLKELKGNASHKIGLLSLSKSVLSKLTKEVDFYSKATIPAGTYSFQSGKVHTLGTPALLVARKSVSATDVATICQQIFAHQSKLAKEHHKWNELSKKAGRLMARNSEVESHPGAKHFFLRNVATKGTIRLATGSADGTYSLVAKDMQRAAIENGVQVLTLESGGSGHNILAVSTGQADMGITQLDVLFSMAVKHPSLVSQLGVVLPLYYEEVHVLLPKGSKVKSLSDLKGKNVHVGSMGSGTSITAELLLKANGLDIHKDIKVDNTETEYALGKLQKGKLDAMIMIGGSPLPLLSKLPKDSGVSLLALKQDDLEKMQKAQPVFQANLPYKVITLSKDTYPWLDKDVSTLATPSLIIANPKVDYDRVKIFARSVMERASTFKHGKWRGYNQDKVKEMFSSGEITLAPHTAIEELLNKKHEEARTDMKTLAVALEAYKIDVGSYPKKLDHLVNNPGNLKKWQGPYLESTDVPKDPWGKEYQYKVADNSFEIVTYGADGKEGGVDDNADLSSKDLSGSGDVEVKSSKTD